MARSLKSHRTGKEKSKVRVSWKKLDYDDAFIPDAEHPDNHTGFASFRDTLS